MTAHATVSATFANLSTAQSAIAALLRCGLRGPDVVLTKGTDRRSYVVTVSAGGRVGQVEDAIRQHMPEHWSTSIDDDMQPAGAPRSLLHIAPEADRLEQDAPWLGDVSPETPDRTLLAGSEADWLEQHQSVYSTDDGVAGSGARAPRAIPEADYAEQLARAYSEAPGAEND
jgi:hypothetical protein